MNRALVLYLNKSCRKISRCDSILRCVTPYLESFCYGVTAWIAIRSVVGHENQLELRGSQKYGACYSGDGPDARIFPSSSYINYF